MKTDRKFQPQASVQPALRALAVIAAGLSLSSCAGASSGLDPHGPEAARITAVSWFLFAVGAGVCLFVIGRVLYATLRPRSSPGPKDAPPGSTGLSERRGRYWIVGGGIVFPLVTLRVVLAVAIATLNSMPTSAAPGDLAVQVTGHQWWWEVYYPAQGFSTANEIHVPVGQQVAIRLSTADVIHSFWVPELAGKLDLRPGQPNTLVFKVDQAGEYRGQCAEFCGVQHALMAILLVAQPRDQFDAWVAGQQQPAATPGPTQE